MPFLIESSKDGKLLRRWDLSQSMQPFTVGRNAETSSIVIPDLNISRNHSTVSFQPPHELVIVDLETRNGTFFNGERIKGKLVADIRKDWSLQFADYSCIYTAKFDDPMVKKTISNSTIEPDILSVNPKTNKKEDENVKQTDKPTPKTSTNPSNGNTKIKAPNSLEMMFERHDSAPETNDFDPTAFPKPTHANLYLPEAKPVKKKRNFESKWDTPAPATVSSSSSSISTNQLHTPVYDEKLQAEAAARARSLAEENKKHLKEKRKLLWNRNNKEEKMQDSGEVITSSVDPEIDPNQYSQSFDSNLDKKSKFLKLMGYRNVQTNVTNECQNTNSTAQPTDNSRNQQLEQQYYQGLKRMDGRKTGLGL